MPTRSKRSLDDHRAAKMRTEILAFQRKVQMWSAEIPIKSMAYVGLSALNANLEIAAAALNENGWLNAVARNPDGGPADDGD